MTTWTVRPTSPTASSEDATLATVFTEGAQHRVHYVNAGFRVMTSSPPAEILGQSLDALLPTDGGGALRTLLDRVFETGVPNAISDVPWGGAAVEGLPRHFTAIASPIASEATGDRGLLVQILDTTAQVSARESERRTAADVRLANEALVVAGVREHALAEAALREKERWNALVENLADGVTVFDRSGHPVLVNPVGRRLLDIALQSGADTDCALCTVAGVALTPERQPAMRALSGESFVDEELVHYRADGSRCTLLFSGSCVRDEAGEVVLAINVYRDVTALRQLEETREEYVALVTHDLRDPLSAISVHAQLLVDSVDAVGQRAEQAKHARAIERGARRLSAMVDELYQASELESRGLQPRLTRVAPAALVADVLDQIGPGAGRDRVVFRSTPTLPMVAVDPIRIHRALANLLTNALKYSEGSRVFVEVSHTRDEVLFSVRDHGPGIRADDLPHVFEKYHRGRVSRDRDGMGLGLYITRRIIHAHRGRISVESEVGHGAKFLVALPIAVEIAGA